MQLLNETRGCVLAGEVEVARSFFERTKGLLGRSELPEGHALLIEKCSSIHMFFMRFAIDVIFVDAAMKVLRVCRDVRPWTVRSKMSASAVVELPAGAVNDENVREGDQLRME